MKTKLSLYSIPFMFPVYATIILQGLVIVFHLLVLLSLIPYSIVWGGRIESIDQMYRYESASVMINVLIIFIVASKSKLIQLNVNEKIINVFIWIFIFLFALNTFGNLLAVTSAEQLFSHL